MRVLWLSPWLRPIARICAESLQENGAEVMLITADLHPESEGERDYELLLTGRPLPTADWVKIPKAYAAAQRFKPDVVVTELLRDPRWRVFGHLAPRIRLLHDDQPHDVTHKDPWWIRSFEPWDARAHATIVFSNYVASRVRETGVVRDPIYVAPLVTDLEPALVPDFVPSDDRRNFVQIGRQRPYKNHKVVLEAWSAHTKGAHWVGDELILLGSGDIDCNLPAYTQWIRCDYKYRDVIDQLARAKGSIVHYRKASQSGVQVASMQLGVPPIISDAGALPEYQPASLSATGVDDVDGLAAAFDQLADPSVLETQSRLTLSHYNNNYAPALAANRLLEIFNDVVKKI